jgi:DNA-binding NarL/FixJ family response regulator
MPSDPEVIQLIIADEHSGFRQQIRRSLESGRRFRVVGEASDAGGIARLIRLLKPDVVLLDLALLRRCEPGTLDGPVGRTCVVRSVVVVTAVEKEQVMEAFRFGAHGIVSRTSAARELPRIVRSVMAGDYWLGRETVPILVDVVREFLSRGNGIVSITDHGLTPRELAITAKIACGRSNKEVGQEFRISERTVKQHLTNVFAKVGVSSRLELAMFAVNHHLVS